MNLQELKHQAYQLPPSDRLALAQAMLESLQNTSPVSSIADRLAAVERLRGLLKTDQKPPTDQEIQDMLEDRRVEKYLQ